MSGAVLLGVVSLICVSDVVIPLYFSAKANRAGDTVGAAPRTGSIDPAKARSFVRMMLISAPLMWLFVAALCFGLFGPVSGITPISF